MYPRTRTGPGRGRKPAPWLSMCLVLAYGCELGTHDLTAYSETAAGPAKIRVVIEDDGYPDALRAEAVVILLDLSRRDVDGPDIAFESLKRLPREQQAGILHSLLERLGPRIGPSSNLSPREQVAAKDVLSRLGLLAQGGVRGEYGALVIEWYTRDLKGRAHAGAQGLDEFVSALGPPAAVPLEQALSARSSAYALSQVVALLDAAAKGPARDQAAQKLIEIERSWRSRGRLTQLEAELEESDVAKRPDAPADPKAREAWLEERAEEQRQAEIEYTLLPALGRFVGTERVVRRLCSLALTPTLPDAQRAAALKQLAGHTLAEQVGDLLSLAAEREQPEELRILALDRAAEQADSDALPQLLAIMVNKRQPQLRQRAAEMVLEIGKGGVLSAFFRAMPKAWAVQYSRGELEAYAERMAEIEPQPATLHYLGEKMHSAYWWARVLALRYYAQRGSREDLWRIRQHEGDYLQVHGTDFPPGYTIGQEAQAALAVAMKRLGG